MERSSSFINILVVGGLIALTTLYATRANQSESEVKKIEIPADAGVPEKGEVKIGEITIIFGEKKGDVQEVVITGSPNISTELEYIHKYFSSTDKELEILKRNPSAKVVCEFSDKLMRNSEVKPALAFVWEYLNKNENTLGPEFTRLIDQLLKEMSVVKTVNRNTVSEELGTPAKTGTVCGFWFNRGYSLISAEKMDRVQELSRKIFALTAEFLQKKVVEKDAEAEKVANVFRNIIFDLLPETNR